MFDMFCNRNQFSMRVKYLQGLLSFRADRRTIGDGQG